jgi:hypothetical protein
MNTLQNVREAKMHWDRVFAGEREPFVLDPGRRLGARDLLKAASSLRGARGGNPHLSPLRYVQCMLRPTTCSG